MSHEWDRGVLARSSWHGLEEIGVLADAAAAIDAGERTGAWPVVLTKEALLTESGLRTPSFSIVADYRTRERRAYRAVGTDYRVTTPEEWRGLVDAAHAAGAQPTGAFSLYGGSLVLATFQVGLANGLRTNLLLADAFDGSMQFSSGFTTIDVVCANTLSMSLGQDGSGMARFRHTLSAEAKIAALRVGIATAIATGEKVRDAHKRAQTMGLSRDVARDVFNALFPEAPPEASEASKTRAQNVRAEAMTAMALPINRRDAEQGTLGTIWNTATWLVDRDANGAPRPVRGDGGRLDAMLFGSRGKRVQEIQTVIEIVLRDGTIKATPATEALEMGVDPRQVGRAVLADMIDDSN